MTGFFQSAFLSSVLSPIHADFEGMILRRGGEHISLQKWDDRLTVRFTPETADPQRLLRQIGAEMVRSIPSAHLFELRVDAKRLEQAMRILRRSAEVEFVSHVYQMAGNSEAPIYLSNQITLQFQPEITAYQIEAIAADMGLQVVKLVAGIPKAFVFQLTKQSSANPLKLANRLLHIPDVLLAEPNIITLLQDIAESPEVPSDLPHNITRGSRSTVVAVMSRAVDLNHAAFQAVGKIIAPWRFQQESEAESSQTAPPTTALDRLEQIAPDCALMPLQLGHFLDDQAIEQVCEWILRQGAAVVVWACEAAGAYYPLSLRQRVAIQQAAMQGRNSRGTVIVVATGAKESSDGLNGFAVHPDVLVAPTGLSSTVAGIVALILSVNPNLSAKEARQTWQVALEPAETLPEVHSPRLTTEVGDRTIPATAAVELAQQQIRLAPRVTRWLEAENFEAVEIPDHAPQGAISQILIEAANAVLDIEVTVHIEHEFMGDLEIFLIPPQGTPILLQSRNLGRLALLKTDYSPKTVPYLKSLLYASAQGEWQLQIIDRAPAHQGELKGWRLKIGFAD